MQRKTWAGLFLILSTLAGCASVPMGDTQADANAKHFAAPASSAAIYIYRNEFQGAAIKMPVDVDGKHVGTNVANTFIYTEVAPGKHTLVSKAENDSELTIDAVAGKIYYVWQEVKIGFVIARTKLHLVDEPTGQAGVKETNLVSPANDASEVASK